MATEKPQGKGPGGKFVDPLDKWVDENILPDVPNERPEAPSNAPKGPKNPKAPKEKQPKKNKPDPRSLADDLINDVDKAAEKLADLIAKTAQPGLSRNERSMLARELLEARKAFREVTSASNKVAAELKESRRLEAQAYAKLNRIKTWRAQEGTAGLSQEEQQAIFDTEQSLKEFIKAMNIFREGDNSENEDIKKYMMASLEKLNDRVESMPDQWKGMFEDENSRLDKILKNQAEAKEFVKQQNDAIKKFGWKLADSVGIGRFNVGNVIRTGQAIARAPKAISTRAGAMRDKIKAGYAYAQKTVEMRRLAKASPIEGGEDPELAAPKDEQKDAKKQTKLLEKYFASSERFRSRLLNKFGKKKKEQPNEDKSFLDGFKDLFGKGGFLKSLLSLAAKVTGVAIAGAVGYWVGTKIWEKIAPTMGEKFNNISGLDAAGKAMTAPVVLNTEVNYNKARYLEAELMKPGSKVTGADQDWLASYYKDNATQAKDMTVYKPSAGAQKINEQQSAGGFARADRTLDAAPGASSAPAVASAVSLPTTVAGAGAATPSGGASPSPAPSIAPIKTQPATAGSAVVSDWVGKTITTSGNVDVKGLQPGMQANIVQMSQEYFAKTGKKLQINSAFRDNAKQEELYRTMPKGMAAPPGSSLHNFGLAFDMSSSQANELQNLGLLQKFGFVRPIQKEPWHVQPAGMTVAAAKAGIYSADGPANQGQNVASAKPGAQGVASAEARVPVQSSDGSPVQTAGGGKGGGTLSSGSKNSASNIPTFDSSDGLLLGMNVGAIAM